MQDFLLVFAPHPEAGRAEAAAGEERSRRSRIGGNGRASSRCCERDMYEEPPSEVFAMTTGSVSFILMSLLIALLLLKSKGHSGPDGVL